MLVLTAASFFAVSAPRESLAIISSDVDINVTQLLGTERFYNAGYTGTRTIQANIEAGHIWNGHNSLSHVTTRVTGTGALGTNKTHATEVAAVMAGRSTGTYPTNLRFWGIAHGATTWSGAIATGFGEGVNFDATNSSVASTYSQILQSGVSGQTADVFNSSWGFSDTTGTDTWSMGVDGLINHTGVVAVIAAGNNGAASNSQVGGIGAGYNSITVGAVGSETSNPVFGSVRSFSSRGPNDFGLATSPTGHTTISAVRASVDIVAPGSDLDVAFYNAGAPSPNSWRANVQGTSYAAPFVAGGASLLVDAGKDLYASNSNAIDGRVIKAALLNSADKTVGWTNGQSNVGGVIQTTQSLDWAAGAGRMNLDKAFDQYVAKASGGAAGTTDLANLTPGDIANVGWDFGSVSSASTNTYFIDTLLQSGTNFTTTLSWFADRSVGNLNNFGGTQEQHLANLDLRVVQFDDPTNRNIIATVAESISLYNTVEHLSFLTPLTGFYGIQVSYIAAHWNFTGQMGEQYGLAWSSSTLAAGERVWANAAGGNFGTSTNWNPVAAPGAADTAVFNLAGTYSVSFTGNASNDRLRVEGGIVTFALGGNSYQLTGDSPSARSVIVGQSAGQNARLVLNNGSLVGVSGIVADAAASVGRVDIGSLASWDSTGEVVIGRLGSGTLMVESGGSMSSGSASIAAEAGSVSSATVTGIGSNWQNTASLYVGGTSSGAGGTGSLTIANDATVAVGDTLKIWNNGTVSLSGGELSVSTLDTTAGAFNMTGGRLLAEEVLGSLTVAGGTFAPGASPGATSISGDYTQQGGATLEMEIGGLAAFTEYDHLEIGGTATLDGTLIVSLVNDFMPLIGDSFDLFDWGTLVGLFDDVELPELPSNLMWDKPSLIFNGELTVLLAGDFDGNGTVDSLDYISWMMNGNLHSDDDYALWAGNYGASIHDAVGSASSSGLHATVPEPTGFVLVGWAGMIACTLRRRRVR